MGVPRKKNKNEILAEKQSNSIREKYPEYETSAKLTKALKDKKISAATDEEKAQAAADLKILNDSEKIIKQNRTEFVLSFNKWKNSKKGQTKVNSMSSFRVLSVIASNKNNICLLPHVYAACCHVQNSFLVCENYFVEILGSWIF